MLLKATEEAVGGSQGFSQPRRQDSAEESVRRSLAEPVENPSTDPLAYWARDKSQVWPYYQP